jgi:hypothetical protein
MIKFTDLTDEQFEDFFYFGFNLTPKESGLSGDIWVTAKPFYDEISEPYIVVFDKFDWTIRNPNYVQISIEDEPKIIESNNFKISAEFFDEIKTFVKINKDPLIKQWTMEYDTRDFNRNKIKYHKDKTHE